MLFSSGQTHEGSLLGSHMKLLKLKVMATTVAFCTLTPFMSGCESTTSNSQTTDRQQLLLADSDEIQQEANQQYQAMLDDARIKGQLNNNKKLYQRVKRISDRLIKYAPHFRADAKDWKWEVNVIDRPDINASCAPGGKIVIYTGIINKLKLTDDEIATILGHEIAHALREHSRERKSAVMIADGAKSIASFLGVDAKLVSLGSTAVTAGVLLPFSRSNETEADELGLELMYDAGFNPYAAVKLWTKMSEISGGDETLVQQLLSTHPADSDRLQNLEELSKKLKNHELSQKA